MPKRPEEEIQPDKLRPDEMPTAMPAPHEPAAGQDEDQEGFRRAADGRILAPDMDETTGEHP